MAKAPDLKPEITQVLYTGSVMQEFAGAFYKSSSLRRKTNYSLESVLRLGVVFYDGK